MTYINESTIKKNKEGKFPIKEWEKEKREEGGKKAPDRGSKEKHLLRSRKLSHN